MTCGASVNMSSVPSGSLRELIDVTRSQLLDHLRAVCGDRPFAHVGTCNHLNVGDVALTAAESRLLDHLPGQLVAYSTSDRPPPESSTVSEDTAYVLHGGGNIGDLYPEELAIRVETLRSRPDSRILQMPQSIFFRDLENATEFRRVVAEARHFVLLVRDRASLEWAQRYLECPVHLVPDAVLALGPLARRCTPSVPVTALIRQDVEALARVAPECGLLLEDWPSERRLRNDVRRLSRWIIEGADRRGLSVPVEFRYRMHRRTIETRLDRGLRLLSRGKYVITDRLHGHILSSLLGIPHAALDNSYGKVWGFMDTWGMDGRATVVRVSELRSKTDVARVTSRLAERAPASSGIG